MNRHDIPMVRTAQDLERKYNFNLMEESNKKNAENITSLNKDLQDFTTQITTDIEDLQNQVDGNITSWFESGVPSLSNYPTNEWATDEEKNNHLGDLYYDQNTGYSYRFTFINGIYNWIKLTDSDITEALAVANAAQDTADKKRRVFMAQPQPPYDNGDMWIKDEEIWICQVARQEGTYQANDFINNLKYTDNTYAEGVNNDLTIVKGTVTTISDNVDELSRTMSSTVEAITSHGTAIGTLEENQTSLTQTVNNLSARVDNIQVLFGTITGTGNIILPNANNSKIGKLKIIGDISLLFPTSGFVYGTPTFFSNEIYFNNNLILSSGTPLQDILYPSNDLYTKNMNLIIEYGENDREIYQLPFTYLNFISETECDEFIVENDIAKIIRNIGINSNGQKYKLRTPVIEELGTLEITLREGNPKLYLQCFDTPILEGTYLIKNNFTETFATKVELHSEISQTADEINLEVSRKVGKNEVVSTINQSAEQITLLSNRLVVDSTNFKLDQDGNVDMRGKLSLNNGKMVFDGTRGLLTNLQYKSNSQFELLGVIPDAMIEINSTHSRYENENTELVINAEIPEDFEIISAKIQLIASPVEWYLNDIISWGYLHNISAFSTTNVDELFWSADGFSDFSVYQNNAILSEMTGSLGTNGYTQPEPNNSNHPTANIYSSDISNILHNGWNRIVLKNRNNAPYYNGSDKGTEAGWRKNAKLCYENTANCMAILNIIGYTKF